MPDESLTLLLTAGAIQTRVAELGAEISRDYRGKEPVLIGVLKGSLVFMADLARRITVPVSVDFMSITSYGHTDSPSGIVRILKDLDESITDRDVILVEDIIDTGLTLTYLLATLGARRPRSLEVCGLLDKTARRIIDVPIRYTGFDIPDEFVIGYGLDFEGRYRNLREVIGVKDLGALADPDAVSRVLAAGSSGSSA
ncbi:MAG TPA: hypoxanthine phosphoribosyltransferase [Actinomycetota bacterium]|nr:hypoxanthine phosphoribosyltransferase [Actinomycetota bacterium]